ncbi:DUF885 family protein [Nonomuraea ceibae]|uniref:DUF885 family protein n=1 Tax=Nonomuraea ceibae TaxID=1935170 RepID=UPI003556092B
MGAVSERPGRRGGSLHEDVTRLGMLSFEAWRACRLVVDTGMHHQDRSRDWAVDFMLATSPVSPGQHRRRDRPLHLLARQAVAYMIGRLRIQDLRHRAKTALCAAFDIRVFPDKVLASGLVPLGTLEEIISEWAPSHGRKRARLQVRPQTSEPSLAQAPDFVIRSGWNGSGQLWPGCRRSSYCTSGDVGRGKNR